MQAKAHAHEDVFTQSFALQYISLILFILIFSIAAFLPKENAPVVEEPKAQRPQAEVMQEQIHELSTTPIRDLLIRGTLQLEVMKPYLTLINNHDINIKVTFYWNENESIYAALTRVNQLRDYLLAQGAPAQSFIVETKYGHSPDASITVQKGASGWNSIAK